MVTSDSVTATAFTTCGSSIATPGSQQDAELAPCHHPARFVLLSIVLKMVLIAHIRSLSFSWGGKLEIYRDTLHRFAASRVPHWLISAPTVRDLQLR